MPNPDHAEFIAPPLASSIMDAIGGTPMVELHRLMRTLNLPGRLLAKLEYLNPGHSKKDRIAREIILEARQHGDLSPGQPVVELTSGNTGTGLAMVCQTLGHPFIAVMSRGNTIERARMMSAFGAEVVLVDQAPGGTPGKVSGDDLALVENRAREIAAQHQAYRADQFRLRANVLAHERHTGPEIWFQSQGKVDAFVDFAGSAGSFTGIARFLKSKNPNIRCYLGEPATAAPLAGKPITDSSHAIQGGGYSFADLPLLDRAIVTDYVQITDADAIASARQLAREEGIFGGFSSGANLSAAVALLRTREPGAAIVFLACDSGLKYLSTDLYPTL